MGSLRDALLEAGLVDKAKPAKAKNARRDSGAPEQRKRGPGKSQRTAVKTAGSSDLERAWRARRQAEVREREAAKKALIADQEARRRRNRQLEELVRGHTLNRKDAETPRYFEHLGRVRRVLCTPQQREQLNGGEIAVVALRGSYLLVGLDVVCRYRELAPDLVPELVGRSEPEDDGSDYPPVPDDLVW